MKGFNPRIFTKRGGGAVFIPLEDITKRNDAYRAVLYTGSHHQLVVMHLRPGEIIDREVHPYLDQFFKVELGDIAIIDPSKKISINAGDAAIVPAGTYHKVIAGKAGAKFYTIYSAPNHPYDKIQVDAPENEP